MFAKRNACKPQKTYNFPTTKLKNVYCTYCKHQFFLQEFIPLYGVIPLLMDCGHIICEKCTKLALGKPCPSCNVIFLQNGSNKTGLPLHIYTLGLMVSSHNRPINTNDLDVSFTKSSGSKFKQHGPCQECGIYASVKCPQCEALYCFICYNKIHGRALNSHSKIVLTNSAADDSCIVQNTCSEKCTEALGYFCEECEIAGCSHCMIRLHKGHTYVSLADKNDMFLEEFDELFNLVGQKLQRIRQAQKKLESTIETPTQVRHSDNVETAVTQHFAYLHGVLQNMEKKIIDSMHHQRDAWSNNTDEILTQLKEYEERLLTAFMIINSVEGNLDKIDIQHVIKKLKKVIDIPCHLVGTSESSGEFRFVVDESIVDTIQKHCNIHIPEVPGFSLQRTELLPDDYEMEPLTEDINIPRVRAKSFTETDPALVSLPPRKNDDNSPFPGSSEMVRVTHVVDPFCFYAQPMKNRSELLELQEGLKTLQNEPLIESSEVKINGMYAVQSSQDNTWYRGRVVNKSTTNDVETYTVFFNDYGMQEENVPLTKIRNIGRFATFPMMVYRCSLFDIVPNGGRWHISAIEAFKTIVATHDMVSINIARVNGETFFVDLCLASYKGRGMVSAKDSLTFMNHGTCVSTTKLMRMNPNSTKTYCKEELPMEYYSHCEILFVESPSCIYVRKNKACRVQFVKLAREMMEYYENAESDYYILSPFKDLPCAARDNDGYWHRGIICEVTENTVKVFFVDLGYSLILSYDDIRTLSNNFLCCKTQAIKISLKNIKPCNGTKDQWGLEVVQLLKKILKTLMPVRVIVLDKFGDTHIAFMHTKDEGDISNMLIKRSLAMSTKTCSSMNKQRNTSKKWKRKRLQSSKENSMETNTLEVPERLKEMPKPFNGPSEMDIDAGSSTDFQENEDPFKVEVLVNQVVSPDCIYVSDVMCEQSDIDKMIQQMQLFYGRFRSAEKVWKEGAVCVVFLSKDNMYYRCTIVEMKENDQALVYLYDKSVEEIVPLKDLQSLYPPFFKVPAYGFKIKLAGILPCGGSTKWPSLSCEKLKEMTIDNCNCKFYISKLEEDDVTESTIPVELWIKQKKVDGPLFPTRVEISSVNRMLVEQGVALPIKEYAKKRDKILAIELKMQYMEKLERLSKTKTNVKWFKIENGRNEENAEPLSYMKYSDSSTASPEEFDTEEEFDNFPSLPKLTTWLPAASISADKFIALPTYLDQDGYLYLHSIEQSAGVLANIEQKLEKLYKHCEIESCDTVWSVGDICIAQYHGNKKWYRGKVVKILENDVFEVEFVDYGNVEECPVGTIKKHVVLENVPIQTTKCLIYGLEPDNDTGKWTTLELDKIHSILIDKKCIVSVLDRTDTCYVISVNIFVCNQRGTTTDLISFLISCGLKIEQDVVFETKLPLAEESEETIDAIEEISDKVISGFSPVLQNKFEVDNSDNCSIATTDIENLSWSKGKENLVASTPYVVSEETLQISYETITAPINAEYIELELTTSMTAITFFAQFKENAHIPMLNEYYKQYTRIMADLQENASKQPMITTIETDIACCAKFDDDVWYRCLICETSSVDDSDDVVVNLKYVDFGNFETRTINRQKSELYTLKKDWFSVPALAIKCKLWNIQEPPSEIPELMITTLRNMYEKVVIATVKEIDEEYTSIEVYDDKDRKELFYGSLIDNGLFKLIVTGKDKHPPSISK